MNNLENFLKTCPYSYTAWSGYGYYISTIFLKENTKTIKFIYSKNLIRKFYKERIWSESNNYFFKRGMRVDKQKLIYA